MGFETAIARRVSRGVRERRRSSGSYWSRETSRPYAGLLIVVLLVAFAVAPMAARATSGSSVDKWNFGGVAKKAVDPIVHGHEHVIEMDTSKDPGFGFVTRSLGVKIETLDGQLSARYYLSDRDCLGGSPRIQLAVDLNGDGLSDGNVFAYFGPFPNFSGCTKNAWVAEALTADGIARWDLTQFGGAFYSTWSQVLAFFGDRPGHNVLRGSLVDDSSWAAAATGLAFYDDLQIGDETLSDPSDVTITGPDSAVSAEVNLAAKSTGFDEFGYNDNARIFVGTGIEWCMGKLSGTETFCAAYMEPYGNDKVVMKWNDEWDRGNAEDWANPPYAAWTSNHWNGNVEGGSGAVWQYKIIWVGSDLETSSYWRPGGYAIWGQFEVVMDQGHDSLLGEGHLWYTHGIPSGYGGGAGEDLATTMSAASSCVSIKDGTLVDSVGNPLVLGFDVYGYNYQAHEFVGTYDSADRVLDGKYYGQTGDFVDDKLAMKWSDKWLSNKDCDGDGKLDRGSSGTSQGWLTNHVVGDYDSDEDGIQDATYTDFVKIVWVGPGGDLWGEYHIIMEVYNDSLGGDHGLLYREGPPGFGLNDGWTTF